MPRWAWTRDMADRQLLVNFRAAPDQLRNLVPARGRLRTWQDQSIIVLRVARVTELRWRFVPLWSGYVSQYATHELAVTWELSGRSEESFHTLRCDTSSRLHAVLGSRQFACAHHYARFGCQDDGTHLEWRVTRRDGRACITLCGDRTPHWPLNSLFRSAEEAWTFFQCGLPQAPPHVRTQRPESPAYRRAWHLVPVSLSRCETAFLNDGTLFPSGSVALDSAWLLQRVEQQAARQPAWACDAATA